MGQAPVTTAVSGRTAPLRPGPVIDRHVEPASRARASASTEAVTPEPQVVTMGLQVDVGEGGAGGRTGFSAVR